MFLRGQIGPCPQWLADLDVSKEVAAIQEKWIDTGKMLAWHNVSDGFPIIGPKFLGAGEDQGLTLWFYTFPTFALFKEWALGAPEHVADEHLAELLVPCHRRSAGADPGNPRRAAPHVPADRGQRLGWCSVGDGAVDDARRSRLNTNTVRREGV